MTCRVVLSFSENDPSHIRDKIFSELKIDDLKNEQHSNIS